MSYADNLNINKVSYENPTQLAKVRTYLEKTSTESTKLIKVEYASKKTSIKRVRYDLRKLNSN